MELIHKDCGGEIEMTGDINGCGDPECCGEALASIHLKCKKCKAEFKSETITDCKEVEFWKCN